MSENKLPGDISLPSSQPEIKKLITQRSGQSKYTVEDFFRLPKKSRYQLSPDGNYISYLGPYNRRLNLFVQKTKNKNAKRITSVADRDISFYFWKDDHLVFGKDDGGDENFHIYSIKADGSGMQDLTPFKGVRINLIDDLEDIESEIIISMNKNNPQLFDPYRLNITTGKLVQLAKNENPMEPIDTWMTDHEGRLRIASKVVGGTNNTLLYRESEDQPFKEVLTTDFKESVSPLFFDFNDPNLVYVSSNLGRDKSVITKLDMLTGKEVGGPIFTHDEVDVSTLSYSRKRKTPTVISYTTDKRHLHFLDKMTEERYAFLEKRTARTGDRRNGYEQGRGQIYDPHLFRPLTRQLLSV